MIKEAQRRNPITGFWENLPHPRWVSVLHTLAYAAFAVAGVTVLTDPPVFLAEGFGGFLTVYWAWLMIVGGLSGVVAVPPGLYIVERFSLGACGVAVLMYGVGLAGLDHSSSSNLSFAHILNTILFMLLVVRAVRIWRGVRDPEKYSTYRRGSRARHYTT